MRDRVGVGLLDGVVGRIETCHWYDRDLDTGEVTETVEITVADTLLSLDPKWLIKGTRIPGFMTVLGDGDIIVFRETSGAEWVYRHVEPPNYVSETGRLLYRQEEIRCGADEG